MNENTYWQWLVQGLGGAVNMIEAVSKSDAKCTRAQLDILNHHLESLMDSASRMKDKVSDG